MAPASVEQPSPGPAVLVTGGARRIGAGIIRRFAAAGWGCLIHHHASHDEALALQDEIMAAGGCASVTSFDLSSAEETAAGIEDAMAQFPELQVIVNCASVFDYDDAAAPDPEVWKTALAVNAFAPSLIAAQFHRLLPEGATGTVVNILDQKLANLNPDYFSYTLSKAALQASSQLMAQALGPKVRVVNVAPGLTMPSGDQTGEEFKRSSVMNLLQRRTTPEDVAEAVFFVATNPYSAGQTLFVDSGQSLTPQDRDVMFLVRQS